MVYANFSLQKPHFLKKTHIFIKKSHNLIYMKNFGKEELNALYTQAREKGKCHNQKQFAELLNLHPSNMSQMLNGYITITDTMARRIADAASAHGLSVQKNEGTIIQTERVCHDQKNFNSTDPEIVRALTAEMAAQREMYAAHVNRLLGIIEKMQG